MKTIAFFLIFACTLISQEPERLTPWYTGSLIALSGRVVPVGEYSFQPYLFVTNNYGTYTNNYGLNRDPSLLEINPLFLFQGGLTSRADFQIILQSFSNFSQGASSTHIGDSALQLGFQILFAKENTSIPNVRLIINQIFPTGKYENAKESKKGTDISGNGTYQTQFGLAIGKIFYPSPLHPTRLRFNLIYTKSTKLTAQNFHVYGGDTNVLDTISPGDQIQVIFAPEYSLNQNWAITTDILYSRTFKTRLRRKQPSQDRITIPSAVRVSLSPAIEYSFSPDFGVIGGVWFSVIGKNSEAFYSPTLSLVYSF